MPKKEDEPMPQLSDKAWRALSALVSDIVTIDTRAGCSDRFFRQHLMLVVNTIRQTGALKEMEAALLKSETEAPAENPIVSPGTRRGKRPTEATTETPDE